MSGDKQARNAAGALRKYIRNCNNNQSAGAQLRVDEVTLILDWAGDCVDIRNKARIFDIFIAAGGMPLLVNAIGPMH